MFHRLLAKNLAANPATKRTFLNNSLLFRSQKTAVAGKKSTFLTRFSSTEGNKPLPGTPEFFDDIVHNNAVTLFMKGTPDEPQCGFSRNMVAILDMHQIPIHKHVNVLDDDNVRQGLKEYSDWPTFPQLYIGGEFVGGFDIALELHKSGEICEEFKRVDLKSALESEYKRLREQAAKNDDNDKKE